MDWEWDLCIYMSVFECVYVYVYSMGMDMGTAMVYIHNCASNSKLTF